jgi:hypothetical protein
MSKWTVEVCQKKDLYNKIIEAFKSKGWEDIASAPATEFNVLRSYDNEERPIFIRLQPQTASGASYNVISTTYTAFVIGVAKHYVPNATPGSPGTFTLSNTASTAFTGTNITTASVQIALDTDNIKLYHNISKTRGYFAVRFNSNIANSAVLGSVFFLGVPDGEFMDSDPRRAAVYMGPTITTLNGLDYPVQHSAAESATAINYTLNLLSQLRTPQLDRSFGITSILYSHANIGYRGSLDGLFFIASNSFVTDGDIVNIKGTKYELLRISTDTASALTTNGFACIEI